ncbi:PspC domain-containing protein [Corynebacterium mayonis]|uniref:ATP-binding protein n=1 Tax=Corynebacterium mayonis TaxID=3062461 RepID=UPI00313FFFAC
MPASSARRASVGAEGVLFPRFTRARRGRVVGGVAAGLSSQLDVDLRWVRVFFAAASFANGFGFLLYAMLWVFSPLEPEAAQGDRPIKTSWPAPVYMLLVALAVVGAVTSLALVSGVGGVFVLLAGIVVVGAVVAWQAYDRGLSSVGNFFALALGVSLVMGGVMAVALLGDAGGTAGIVVAVLATVFGIALLVVPLVVRLASSLVAERQAKAVADQRAEFASRLHDSVLQTLALIQKHAGDSAHVARLARSQERELRAWLFDADSHTQNETRSLFGAVAKAAGEVEDLHGVSIRPVTVGEDVAYTHQTEAIVMAAREAMVNAAKHAGVARVDVYAEHLGGEVSVFVRDRGPGFDVAQIPEDRHGVRDSIIGRMERAGGTATISAAAGHGTEVALSLAV